MRSLGCTLPCRTLQGRHLSLSPPSLGPVGIRGYPSHEKLEIRSEADVVHPAVNAGKGHYNAEIGRGRKMHCQMISYNDS